MTTAHATTSRSERALRLFEEHGSSIRQLGPETYSVPSCTGSGVYTVHYGGELESCTCPDHVVRGETCKHLLAVGIMHANRRSGVREVRTVAVAAGDPIAYAKKRKGCPACFGGYVTITVEEDGEEHHEAVPCRRCRAR